MSLIDPPLAAAQDSSTGGTIVGFILLVAIGIFLAAARTTRSSLSFQ